MHAPCPEACKCNRLRTSRSLADRLDQRSGEGDGIRLWIATDLDDDWSWAHLQDVENREVDELTNARVVHLRSLDDNRMGGQVDTPRKSRRAAEDLQEQT